MRACVRACVQGLNPDWMSVGSSEKETYSLHPSHHSLNCLKHTTPSQRGGAHQWRAKGADGPPRQRPSQEDSLPRALLQKWQPRCSRYSWFRRVQGEPRHQQAGVPLSQTGPLQSTGLAGGDLFPDPLLPAAQPQDWFSHAPAALNV